MQNCKSILIHATHALISTFQSDMGFLCMRLNSQWFLTSRDWEKNIGWFFLLPFQLQIMRKGNKMTPKSRSDGYCIRRVLDYLKVVYGERFWSAFNYLDFLTKLPRRILVSCNPTIVENTSFSFGLISELIFMPFPPPPPSSSLS